MVSQKEEACRKARSRLDAHVSGEPDSGRGSELRSHLDACPACAALLDERLRVRSLVQRAVRGVAAPSHLAAAVREMIRQG